MSQSIKLGPAVGAYANSLFEARAADEVSTPKYGITLLFPKSNPKALAALRTALDECFILKFGKKDLEAFHNNVRGYKNFPIRDGDVEKPDQKEFVGHWFISARCKNKPGVVDRRLQPVMSDEEAYSGCKFVISCSIYAYDKAGNKGVSVGLNNAMVYEKGVRIDGRKDAATEFAEFAEEGEGSNEDPLS